MYFFVAESPVDYAASAAFGSPLLVFGILVVIAQKVLIGDQNRFVTHGGKGFVADPRPSKLAPVIISVYGFVAVVLPVAALAVLSLSPFWSASIGDGGFSLDNFRVVLDNPKTIAGITNSLVLSLGAAVIALPLGYVVATILVRTGPRFRLARQAIDFMVAMPLGVPGVVYGLGFLLAYGLSPFYLYATKSIIVIAYVTLMLPFATRMLLSGMVSIGKTYQEASRTSGAGVIRTNANILLPLLRPTFLGAFILIFIMLTHEFSASLFVRAASTNVMGTLLYDMYGLGSYPLVAAVALIMTVITAIGVALAFLVGGSDALDKM
jgi:ABC-type spermidine/putrescine transport system, permease component II